MGTNATGRLTVAILLLLAAGALAGVLLAQHHGEPAAVGAVNEACGDGQRSGCEDVARNSWSSAAGLPLAAWGLAFYVTLALALLLALAAPPETRDGLAALAFLGLALGLIVDLLLLGVQAFAIKAYCKLCIATYVLAALAFVLLLPARRALRAVASLVGRPDSRLALAGSLLGGLLAAAGVLGWNSALAARAEGRQANLLGRLPAASEAPSTTPPAIHDATAPATAEASPAPPVAAPSAAPATTAATAGPIATAAAGTQDAQFWRAQAQKLQETLDDPRKFEAYRAEKARREFEAAPVTPIDLAGLAARGPETAPVKVVAFSDFLCPFCRNLGLALAQFVPQAAGRVAVYHKNFPLETSCNSKIKHSLHPGACTLALGAICAQRQGKFDAYHDRVFGSELRNPQAADVARLAGEAGLNAAAMQGCLEDPRTKETLAAQIEEAHRLGISSTPTVYINGKKLPNINDFLPTVDREAQKQGWKPLGQ